MAIKEIISKISERLETVPDNLNSSVIKTQRQIVNEIIDLLSQLERKGDLIVMNKKNLLLIETIADKMKSVVLGSDYVKAVRDFVGEFDTQAAVTDKYFKAAFKEYSGSDVAKEILKVSKKNAVELLLGTPMDANFLMPVKGIIEDAVSSGASWSGTVKSIREFVEGNDQVDGKLLRYSKQISSDAFATSDRAYTNAISDELEIEWYFYTGGLLKDSREFCEEHNNKYYHYKEVEAWASKDWAGKMPNTNAQTIFITAGGFNCKHSIMPVSIFIVPKEDIERNIRNGNYKPTKFEIEELGLVA